MSKRTSLETLAKRLSSRASRGQRWRMRAFETLERRDLMTALFNSLTGHYYEFVATSPDIVWTEAKAAAESNTYRDLGGVVHQGYLATITSKAEDDVLHALFGGNRSAWLGGSDEAVEGEWRWVTGPEAHADDGRGQLFWSGDNKGTAHGYAAWRSSEPNNVGDEDYVVWNHQGNGWNDSLHEPFKANGDPDRIAGYIVEYGDSLVDGDVSSRHIQYADVNGDEFPDVVFFDSSAERDTAATNKVYVGINDGTGAFDGDASGLWWEQGPSSADMLQVADVTGDGKADAIYFDTSRSNGIYVGVSDGTSFRGEFSGKWWEHGPSTPSMLQFAKVDGDDKWDAVYFDTSRSGGIWVGLSDGTKFVDQGQWWEHGPSTPDMLQLADVTGDKKADAIYFDTSRSRGVWVGVNDGSSFRGGTTGKWWQHGPSTPDMIQYADVTGDGYTDAIYFDVWRGSHGVWVGVNDGGTSFQGVGTGPWWEHGQPIPEMLQLADVTGDGKLDAIYFDGGVWVGVNNGSNFREGASRRWEHGPSRPDMINYLDINGDNVADALIFDGLASQSVVLGIANPETRSFDNHGPVYPESFERVIDLDGTVYELSIPIGRKSGTLSRTGRDATEEFNNIFDFTLQDDELHLIREDKTKQIVPLRVEPKAFLDRHAQPPDDSNGGGAGGGSSYNIVGNTGSVVGLNRELMHPYAANYVLGSVGSIEVWSGGEYKFNGTGTVLNYGGNWYVLTASHVVDQFDKSQLKFVSQPDVVTPFPSGTDYSVTFVWDRSFFAERDIALLQLDRPVQNVTGAFLPNEVPVSYQEGKDVITVGYGRTYDGDRKVTSGRRLFGFSPIDAIDYIDQEVAGRRVVGDQLVYEYNSGEAATAKGDSGGPDIIPSISGGFPAPVIVGVHSFIDIGSSGFSPDPNVGQKTWSVQMTTALSQAIIDTIPLEPKIDLEVFIYAFENGDSGIGGDGEWQYTLMINGVGRSGFKSMPEKLDVSLNRWRLTAPENKIRVQFSGTEKDDGFFNGEDETIPTLARDFEGARRLWGSYWDQRSELVTNGDIRYNLLARLWQTWGARARANTTPVNLPSFQGAPNRTIPANATLTTANAFFDDTTPPAVSIEILNDSGVSNHDRVTMDGRFRVDAGDGVLVALLRDGQPVTTDGDGVLWVTGDGEHLIELTSTDVAGNEATVKLQFVLDSTLPSFAVAPSSINVKTTTTSGAIAEFGPFQASDEFDDEPSVTCSASSGGVFPMGETEVTCTATDDAGNSSQVSFNVLVTWAYDTDGDGVVAPIDLLRVINHINKHGSGPVTSSDEPYDTNRDGFVTPLDVLVGINFLNARHSFREGEGFVLPEPTRVVHPQHAVRFHDNAAAVDNHDRVDSEDEVRAKSNLDAIFDIFGYFASHHIPNPSDRARSVSREPSLWRDETEFENLLEHLAADVAAQVAARFSRCQSMPG